MASPAFWDDNRRAQELIRERAELARLVARGTELGGQASDLAVLLELAGEAGGHRGAPQSRGGGPRLQRQPRGVGRKGRLSGPPHPKGAHPPLPPGGGGP